MKSLSKKESRRRNNIKRSNSKKYPIRDIRKFPILYKISNVQRDNKCKSGTLQKTPQNKKCFTILPEASNL
jgi:hypothetical protein